MNTVQEYRKYPHHSFSSLNLFLRICPLQYAFRYIYKSVPEHTPVNLVFGKAFHSTLEWYAVNLMQGTESSVSEFRDVFSEHWRQFCRLEDNISFRTGDEWEQLNSTGRKMIECVHENWADRKIISVSHAFSVPVINGAGIMVSEKPLIGEFDLVLHDENNYPVIVDWKTAAAKWPLTKADRDLQATCFSYAYWREHQVIPQFRFDVVTKTKTPSYTQHHTARTHDDFRRLAKLVEVVEDAVKHELFFPNESSFSCSNCVHAEACRKWHNRKSRVISSAA